MSIWKWPEEREWCFFTGVEANWRLTAAAAHMRSGLEEHRLSGMDIAPQRAAAHSLDLRIGRVQAGNIPASIALCHDAWPVRREHAFNVFRRTRRTEQITLHLGATLQAEKS